MPTDDGNNFLRISHPAPIGIKYWEIGNEIYGNGYYHGNCGWEADMRVPVPARHGGTTCTGRKDNAALSPPVYGMAVKQYAAAMKAVDPTIKIGAVLIGNNEYPDWNAKVLAAACPSFDIAILHWYGGNVGTGLSVLPSAPEAEIPGIFSTVRSALATPMFGCPADLPVMVTEWGPNSLSGNDLPVSMPDMAPVGIAVRGPLRRRVVRELHGAGRARRPLARAAQPQLPRPDRLERRSVHPVQRHPALGPQGHEHRPPAGGRQRHHGAGDGVGHLRRGAQGARVRCTRTAPSAS